jgi:hypothetical protein
VFIVLFLWLEKNKDVGALEADDPPNAFTIRKELGRIISF